MSIQDLPPIEEIDLPEGRLADLFGLMYHENGNTSNVSNVYDMYEMVYGVQFTERDVAKALIRFLSPFFLLLGTVGNIFNVIIMARLCTEVLSTCVYLAMLGGVDMFLLYTQCGNEWLRNIAEVDLTDQFSRSSVSACKAYNFVFSFFAHLYRWLIVCIAVEGLISTRTPDKITVRCSLSRAKAIILLITVLLVCVNIHYFWTFELINTNDYAYIEGKDEQLCLPNRNMHVIFEDYVRPIMNILVAGVFPFVAVAICSVLMTGYMCGSQMDKQKQVAEDAWRKRYLLYPYALQRLKVCILIICILYIFLTLPDSVMKLFVNNYGIVRHSSDIRSNAKKELIEAVARLLEYLFLSVKFIIYVSICQQFRDEYYRLSRQLCNCIIKRCMSHPAPYSQRLLITPSTSNHVGVSDNRVCLTDVNTNNQNNCKLLLNPISVRRFTDV